MWLQFLSAGVCVGVVCVGGLAVDPPLVGVGLTFGVGSEQTFALSRLAFEAHLAAPSARLAGGLVPLVRQLGLPEHVLGAPRAGLVCVWSDSGAPPVVVWFDANGLLEGRASGEDGSLGPLDPRRAPVLRRNGTCAELVLPQLNSPRRILDLATGQITTEPSDDTTRRCADALALLNAGDTLGAVTALEVAVADDPSDPKAWRELARAIERSGDNSRAVTVLARGVAAVHAGRLTPVSTEWRVLDPRARLSYDLVQQYTRTGQIVRAEAALEATLRHYPHMQEAVLHRASSALRTDPIDGRSRADALLRAALVGLDCPRERAAAHLDAATFHERAGAFELARAHLDEALACGEDREIVVRGLARLAERCGQFGDAVEALTLLRERWVQDLAPLVDERRRDHALERLARLDEELASLHARAAATRDTPR